MGAATTKIPARTFKQKLRAELNRQEVGVRTLARRMHEIQPPRPEGPRSIESIRRQLKSYLTDGPNLVTPTAETREWVEDALGLERDSLKDDEEGDRAMRMTIPVTVEVPLEALEKHLNYDLLARAVEARQEHPPEQSL